MKQQKFATKKFKKPNIPLRRKIAVFSSRIILASKIFLVIFIYLLLFTKHLNFIRNEISQSVYEITADIGFNLENVLIEGQVNTKSQDILSTLNADTGTSILSIDLDEVKSQIEKISWIKKSIIERRLPSTIYIGIIERIPIAIWQVNQKLYLVDDEGYKITNSNIEKFANLLHIVGPDANIYAKNLLDTLNLYPELISKIVSAVRYGERRWNLNFQQQITVKMPESGFEKALEYLSELQKSEKLFDQNLKSLDLRNPSKYYLERY